MTSEIKETVSTPNQVTSEKSQTKTNPHIYSGSKKDEIKILPAVVPVLGYTAATPNMYPPIEGVQLFTGTQSQPSTFPTTYQQGVCIFEIDF